MSTTPARDWGLSVEDRIEAARRRVHAVARIVFSTDDGPIRTIITGTKRRPTGVYHSIKTGLAQPYESPDERRFMSLCEADYDVSHWIAQPHRLEMFVEGTVVKYFPDFEVFRRGKASEVIEIKRDKANEVRGELKEKLVLAATIYRLIGVSFRILDRADMSVEPRLSNANEIQRHAYTRYFETELFNLRDKVMGTVGRQIPFGAAVELLGGGIVGKKKLCAMIVRRQFAVDLDLALNDETPVLLHLPRDLF